MDTEHCVLCGWAPIYAQHKQVAPDWLPEELAPLKQLPVCFACHNLIVADQWPQLVERIALCRVGWQEQDVRASFWLAAQLVTAFVASDAGEYDLTPEW